MALCSKKTFLEFEGINAFDLPAVRRSASEGPLIRHRHGSPVVADLHIEPLSQALSSGSSHSLRNFDQPCPATSASLSSSASASALFSSCASPSSPVSPSFSVACGQDNKVAQNDLLQMPAQSRLLLSKLTSRGFQQLQQRMEEPCAEPKREAGSKSCATSFGDAAVRWCDVEVSDSEVDASFADTESTRADSDESPCGAQELQRSKKAPAKNHASRRSARGKPSGNCAEAQLWVGWNMWDAVTPAMYPAWTAHQESQWW